MKGFGPTTFGELNAEEYDALHDPGTTEACVDLIADLAGDGDVLELAIGTGRIALPLAERGLNISGFDASPEMLKTLAGKPGGSNIETWVADMARFDLERKYDFAFLVFNTLYNITAQHDQVACFQQVANHLRPGGRFLVEAFLPNRDSFENNQAVRTKYVSFDSVWLEAVQHDPVAQTLNYQRVRITENGTQLKPLPMRYVWPAELDLMAEISGLRPVAHWGGWQKQALSASSDMYVIVYEKPET
ncbi:MAG: class I SAM-dependent methyltransferase [Henriciella sp.]|nr:class I SAM-dependent methyltransferase [Henriciella sp.]MBO6695352.1 class I SAM-dependent methyltransferase [Henriciella sp.]